MSRFHIPVLHLTNRPFFPFSFFGRFPFSFHPTLSHHARLDHEDGSAFLLLFESETHLFCDDPSSPPPATRPSFSFSRVLELLVSYSLHPPKGAGCSLTLHASDFAPVLVFPLFFFQSTTLLAASPSNFAICSRVPCFLAPNKIFSFCSLVRQLLSSLLSVYYASLCHLLRPARSRSEGGRFR